MNYRPASWDRMSGDERVAWIEARREQRTPGQDPALRGLAFQERARAKLLRRFVAWKAEHAAASAKSARI